MRRRQDVSLGDPIMTCTSCGRANRDGARFCDACGTALVARLAGAEARKVVTIVFADLVGSTSLHERLDAESARRLMDGYYRALRAAVDKEGGALVKLLGDGVMAAFGVPRVTEDDAIRAVRAAVGMQRAVRELGREAVGGLRVAVNTGEVVVSDDHTDVVGDPVNVAARLQQEAHDGDVLIGESTQRLVGHLVTLAPFGVLALKGRAETVAAYRVVSLDRPAVAPAAAFVGRDDELRRLTAIFDRTIAAPRAHLAVVLGSPGLGKSRLLAELGRRLGDRATVLTARCDAAGGATFEPVAEALRAFLAVDDGGVRAAVGAVLPPAESERVRIAAGVAGLVTGTPAPPEETFFVVRRLLAAVAATRPVVLAIDDLQWAEPLLLELIEHLIQWSAAVPLLVLAAARPELRETRASLATPGGVATEVVTLAGLDAGAATRLAANVIGADALPAAVAGRVLATSEGNPLFVGELVRMLVQDGVLKREGDRWTAGVAVADLEMPPTIQALLAARIERLAPEERVVLERAAVVGRHFSRDVVAHLLPPELRADLARRLDALRRSELIESDASAFFGAPALRFHHVLVRDAAYRRSLKGTRAELHGRVAEWLESKGGGSAEHDETIGWHLEQAHQHLRELGPVDGAARAYGERAARYLAAAGRRALARDDSPRAASLLGRAIDRLDDRDATRAELALEWCEALLAAGDVGTAARAIAELERFARDSDRLRAWHACFTGQLAALTDPQSLRTTAAAVAAAADALAGAGDAAGEAKAHSVHATALARLGKMAACEVALDQALAAARRARDRRRANAVLAGAPLAALWGPSPVARASGRCLDVVRVLRITQGAPAVEAVALRCQAVLEALRGRTEAARRMIASSRHMVEELGITPRLLEADVFAGLIELLEGDAAAAERWLRSAYDGLRDNGLGIDAAQAAALLGRALLVQGRADEAEALSYESESLAGDDLKAASAWRGVRAEALARRGEHAVAIGLARAAVEVAETTDALLDHADARMALTAALRAGGRFAEADAEEARAIALWEAKGATVLVARARRDVPHDGHLPRMPEPSSSGRRRVVPNAAVANVGRVDAALMARDVDALPALVAGEAVTVHHPTGRTYDRAVMLEQLDADRDDDALRRFAELTGEATGVSFENAVTRAQARFGRLWRERDLDRVLALYAPTFVLEDRRAVVGLDLKGEDFLTNMRFLFGQPSTWWDSRPLATRGDRLALFRIRFGADLGDGDRVLDEHVAVIEQGPDGANTALVAFDVGAVEAAYAELDRRYAAGEAAVYAELLANVEAFRAASVAREWTALARLLPDDFNLVSHRRLVGTEKPIGRDEYLATRGSVDDLGIRGDLRVDHWLRLSPRAGIAMLTWLGTVQGGEFEDSFILVFTHDGRLLHGCELYDVDRIDAATARHEELSAEPANVQAVNAATRAQDRFEEAWVGRDWERVLATYAPAYRLVDRRSLMRIDMDREQHTSSLRRAFEMPSSHLGSTVVATRGERLALIRQQLSLVGRSVGASELETLLVLEADRDGRRVTETWVNPDDLDAAYVELDAQYDAGEGASHRHAAMSRRFRRAFADRDWQTLEATLAPDLVVHDHRVLGWETLDGPGPYIEALRSLVELAPDVRLRIDHVIATSPDAVLYVPVWVGTRDGGPFEAPSVIVAEFDDGGRIRRFDQYDVDRLDEARARLDAVAGRVDPLRIPPNTVIRTMDRWQALVEARDWAAVASLFAPTFVFEDRRRGIRQTGDLDMMLASMRHVVAGGARVVRTVLATWGEYLALCSLRFTGPNDAAEFEIDTLQILEVDPQGRMTANIVFDLGDRRAAAAEMRRRFARFSAASTVGLVVLQAFDDRDLGSVRAVLPDDFVLHDHRHTGAGRIEGADAYVAWLAALMEQSPDAIIEPLYTIDADAHGALAVAHTFGTLVDGGAFENVFAQVLQFADDRVVSLDLYELGDLEVARARFESIRRPV